MFIKASIENNRAPTMDKTRAKVAMSLQRLVSISCFLLVALVAINLVCEPVMSQERLTVEGRQSKDGPEDLAATIKYLESVDKLYSHLSRPRFGRSEYKQAANYGGPQRVFLASSRRFSEPFGQDIDSPLSDLLLQNRFVNNLEQRY